MRGLPVREVASWLDRIPVLLISGIVNPAVVDRAARVGSAGVMQKPFSADELAGKVNDLLGLRATERPEALAVNRLVAAAAACSTPRPSVRPAGLAPTAPARPPERPVPTLDGCLSRLAAAEGVHSVVLADRSGHLIGSARRRERGGYARRADGLPRLGLRRARRGARARGRPGADLRARAGARTGEQRGRVRGAHPGAGRARGPREGALLREEGGARPAGSLVAWRTGVRFPDTGGASGF